MPEVKTKKKVAIIGYGYVGKGVYNFFEDRFETIFYDPPSRVRLRKMKSMPCDLGVVRCRPRWAMMDLVISRLLKKLWVGSRPLLFSSKALFLPAQPNIYPKNPAKKICFSPEYMGEGGYFVPFWKYADPKDMKSTVFRLLAETRKAASGSSIFSCALWDRKPSFPSPTQPRPNL